MNSTADITIAFVHFKTLTLDHLDAAWCTLARQDFTGVARVLFFDNNTDDSVEGIWDVLDRYPLPVPVEKTFAKHGDATRTHSWSVNQVLAQVTTPWVFFMRTDFLLDPQCLQTFRKVRDRVQATGGDWRGFVTSWCHQMGCDDALSNTDVLADHSKADAPWRTHPDGPRSLIGQVPSCRFTDADKDAGVWLTRTDLWEQSGGLNERLVSWGYQQSVWQTALRAQGVEIVQLEDFLFHHQHHYAPRSVAQANAELHGAGGA